MRLLNNAVGCGEGGEWLNVPCVLITGAAGSLGSDLCDTLGRQFRVVPATRRDFDITNLRATRSFVSETKPDVIIHPAAFTDVDGCEAQSDKAFLVNGLGTRNAALAASEIGARLFYISTDYVFDGTKDGPYSEWDAPNPVTVYGKSKLLGEEYVKQHVSRHFIIRIAWLYGQNGNNFVKTMLRLAQEKEQLGIVNDQRGTPTWTVDIAKQIRDLLPTKLYGTYHCTSQGSCTWYEFALEIFKNAGYVIKSSAEGSVSLIPNPESRIPVLSSLTPNTQSLRPITVRPVTSDDSPRPAKRPKNSVLRNHMLQLQGMDIMPHWKEALEEFMNSVNSQRSTDHKVVMRDE